LINSMLFLSITGCCFLWLQMQPQIPNIGTHVIINQKLSGFGLQMHFQRYGDIAMLLFSLFESMYDFGTLFYYRAVPIAMDRAIKEIVTSIVQRSVSIATQTTKELVLKVYIFVMPRVLLLDF